jgi:B12-binding domain/radical SAM domain protein
MKPERPALGIRLQTFNRLTFPVILHELESSGLQRFFHITLIRNRAELQNFIGTVNLGLLFYSFMTPHLVEVAGELKDVVQQKNPLLKTVAGGPHTSGDPTSSLKMGFDYAFSGAAETGLSHFIQDFLGNRLPRIPTVYIAPALEYLDESMPFSNLMKTSPPLELTRGCYWNCRFCQTSCRKAVHRSMDSVADYYEELRHRGHHQRVNFICPSAFEYGANAAGHINQDAIETLLDYFLSRDTVYLEFGIFPSEIRPNTFSESLLDLVARKCSNKKITVGAQSGSPRLLKIIRRGHTPENIENACELSLHKNLQAHVDFIFGFPDETSDDRNESLKLIMKLYRRYRARIHLHYFMPLSGTDLEYTFPKRLDYKTMDILEKFQKDGICTGWWREGLKLSESLVKCRDKLRKIPLDYTVVQPQDLSRIRESSAINL